MPRKNKNAGRKQKRTPSHERKAKKSTRSKKKKNTRKASKQGPTKKSSRARKTKSSGSRKAKDLKLFKRKRDENSTHDFLNQKFVGRLSKHPDGFAFFLPENPDAPHVYIAREELRECMQGDKVEILIHSAYKDDKYRGKILKIIEHKQKEFLGTLRRHAGGVLIIPGDARDRHLSFKASNEEDFHTTKSGSSVLCKILEVPGKHHGLCELLEVIENPEAPHNDTLRVLMEGAWPRDFSEKALKEAQQSSEDWKERWNTQKCTDRRNLSWVTIDGADARDFDDAVYAKSSGTNIELWVGIADVSHFVREGQTLNEEALERSTSVYFPDHVVPMLPEVLSNGACSLNPHEDRAALVCKMTVNKEGQITKYVFEEALIQSKHRFTYEEVQAFLEEKKWASEKDISKDVQKNITTLKSVFKRLLKARHKRGAIDLDIPEAQIFLNKEGAVKDIQERTRLDAHKLIEECMIAANVCASRFLYAKRKEAFYRVHEKPELKKIAELQEHCKLLGISSSEKMESAKDFSKLAAKLQKLGPDKAHIAKTLQFMILRSLQQARYCEERLGHFALALEDYTHFTSPIRRYPDLIVHRMIKEKLGLLKKKEVPTDLAHYAGHCSTQERSAVDMERRLIDLKKCRYMEEHLGSKFEATIINCIERGLFAQIDGHFVDGLISAENLARKGSFQYNAREMCFSGAGNIQLKVGSRVKIQVARVDLETTKIDFEFLEFL